MVPATESPCDAARPVVFGECAGWLHDAGGDVGLVLCSPWGFEELCMRRAWRMLADEAALAGYPTIRFDYPGTGDSLGDPDQPHGLDGLVDAALAAVATLRAQTGVRRIILCGQGLGAIVATLAASQTRTDGLAVLAGPARGREHLRELCVWASMVAEAMHLPLPHGFGQVAGFDLPESLRADISKFDAAQLRYAPDHVLVAARAGRAGEARLAARLAELGASVSEIPYENYDLAVGNPTAAQPPVDVIGGLIAWLATGFASQTHLRALTPDPGPAVLCGPDFRERAVRIGSTGLTGVLCEPLEPRRGSTVLMLSAGGDPHIGWARSNVDQARMLARTGVASLRLDCSDVGDSRGATTDAPVRLYNDGAVQDALAAIDWLEAQGLGPVLPSGRCSGAWTAFNAALRDPRVREVVLVNQRRFVWREGEVEAATDKVGHYKRQARNPLRLLVRWIRGELDLEAALARLTPAAISLAAGLLRGHRSQLQRQNHAALKALAQRGVRLNLLYAADGEAHADLKALFGAKLRGLQAYSNVALQWLTACDHSLTPPHARTALLELTRSRALDRGSLVAVGGEDGAARRPELAPRPGLSGGALAT